MTWFEFQAIGGYSGLLVDLVKVAAEFRFAIVGAPSHVNALDDSKGQEFADTPVEAAEISRNQASSTRQSSKSFSGLSRGLGCSVPTEFLQHLVLKGVGEGGHHCRELSAHGGYVPGVIDPAVGLGFHKGFKGIRNSGGQEVFTVGVPGTLLRTVLEFTDLCHGDGGSESRLGDQSFNEFMSPLLETRSGYHIVTHFRDSAADGRGVRVHASRWEDRRIGDQTVANYGASWFPVLGREGAYRLEMG
jgi:hypothetical protein